MFNFIKRFVRNEDAPPPKTPQPECPKDDKLNPSLVDFDVNNYLLSKRQLFLFDEINEKSALRLIKELRTLETCGKEPILLWINSPGGCVGDGFAIIDTIQSLAVPVITIVNGEAASMAGIISVCGDKRIMTPNSVWMAHDISALLWDYGEKMKYRLQSVEKAEKQCVNVLKAKTKLTLKDLETAKHGELWLNAKECKKKGIIDNILIPKEFNARKCK